MTAPDLLTCPFCTEGKTVSTYFDHEQGDKWGYASCDACGARGPEVRTNYDRDDNAPWRAAAIAAWNTRATPAAMTPEVRALAEERDRLKEALYIDDLTVTLQGEDRARLMDRNKNLEAALRKGEALKYVLCDIQDRDTYLSRGAWDALKSFCDALAALRAGGDG